MHLEIIGHKEAVERSQTFEYLMHMNTRTSTAWVHHVTLSYVYIWNLPELLSLPKTIKTLLFKKSWNKKNIYKWLKYLNLIKTGNEVKALEYFF